MDLSQFLDVSCDVVDEPLANLNEDDIVLIDDEPATAKPPPRCTPLFLLAGESH